jgi:3',5'-cyclic AMP phosphodiesterase CpdA
LLRILHVSDVHFGRKHVAELSDALSRLVVSRRPTAVVVSGDLTQRAKPREFRQAREWLDGLAAPTAFVPGNHDVPMYRAWERLLSPFGAWRRHLDARLIRDHHEPGLAVLGLNTAHAWTVKHGRVVARELARVRDAIRDRATGTATVVVAHHPLARSERLGREPLARRGRWAFGELARAGADVVLSGHLHHGFWIPPEETGGPLVVHSGTTTSSRGRGAERGRNSLNWLEIKDGRILVERHLWSPSNGAFEIAEAAEFSRRAPGTEAPGVP